MESRGSQKDSTEAHPELQAHQDVAARLEQPSEDHTSTPRCSSDHETDTRMVLPDSDALEVLRSQMNACFDRRNEAFLQAIFDKHKSDETPDCAADGLSQTGLMSALADAGIHVSVSEAEELHKTQDLNSNGCIDWSEFLSIVSMRVGRVAQWASTLPLAELLADCMPIKNEADPVRAVSKLSKTDVQNIVACYSEGLARLLNEKIDQLERAYESMERAMENASQVPAPTKFTLPRMECGNIDDFHNGLSGRIGDPHLVTVTVTV
jgi:hypothetical protein